MMGKYDGQIYIYQGITLQIISVYMIKRKTFQTCNIGLNIGRLGYLLRNLQELTSGCFMLMAN